MCITIRLLTFTCLLTLLQGCQQPAGQEILEDYLYRMANATGQDIDQDLATLPAIPTYPAKRDRLLTEIELREGVFDTLKFRHCGLLNLIAERNSSLGKVMPPSQKLRYELRFFGLARQCLQRPEIREDLEFKAQLTAIVETKQRNLHRVLWNAVYNSQAMERNFALNQPPLEPNAKDILPTTLETLGLFQQIALAIQSPATFRPPTQLDNIEHYYKNLEHNRLGAQWLTSIRMLTATFARTADAIQQRLDKRKVCPQGKPTKRSKILHNVFIKFYAGQVQPYFSTVDKVGQQWLSAHDKLLGSLQHSDKLNHYRQQVLSTNSKLWQAYLAARQDHVNQWQRLLRQCGLMPSAT